MRQVLQGTYPLMSITLELPGSPGWHSLQTYVAKYKVAKIGDIAEGELSFEVR